MPVCQGGDHPTPLAVASRFRSPGICYVRVMGMWEHSSSRQGRGYADRASVQKSKEWAISKLPQLPPSPHPSLPSPLTVGGRGEAGCPQTQASTTDPKSHQGAGHQA